MNRWRSCTVTLLILLSLRAASTAEATWKWTEAEKERIAAYEKQAAQEHGFYVVHSARWDVKSDVSARFTAELTCFLELFYDQLHTLLRIEEKALIPNKPCATVFSKPEDYRKLFTDGTRGHCKWKWNASGMFTEYGLYTYIKEPAERDFVNFWHPILQHEATHLLLERYLGRNPFPCFIDEGLATYFEFWDLRADTAENVKKRYARSFYPKYLPKNFKRDPSATVDLAQKLSLTYANFNPDRTGPIANENYALAESLIETIVSTTELGPILPKMLKASFSGKGPDALTADEIKALSPAWYALIRKREP